MDEKERRTAEPEALGASGLDGAIVGEDDDGGERADEGAESTETDAYAAINHLRQQAAKRTKISIPVRLEDADWANVVGYPTSRDVKLEVSLGDGMRISIKVADLAYALRSFDEDRDSFRNGLTVEVKRRPGGQVIEECNIISDAFPDEPLNLTADELDAVLVTASEVALLLDHLVRPTVAIANARAYWQNKRR